MVNSFRIYAHNAVSIPALSPLNQDFQITQDIFLIDNRVSNAADLEANGAGPLLCSMNIGGNAGSNEQNQNASVSPAMWLPPYRFSEATRHFAQLQPYTKQAFIYDNLSGQQTDLIQTAFLGHGDYSEKYTLEFLRPFNYYTKVLALPAPQSVAVDFISIQPGTDFLVRAFVATLYDAQGFPVSLLGSDIAIQIRDMSSAYTLMNVPILAELFCNQFDGAFGGLQLPNVSNFRPRGFAPWIAPQKHQYEITFSNLGGLTSGTVQFGFWGNLIKYKVS